MYKNSNGHWRSFNEDMPYAQWTFDQFMESGALWSSALLYGAILLFSSFMLWGVFMSGALLQRTIMNAGANDSVFYARAKFLLIYLVANMFLVTDRSMIIGEFLYSYVRPLYWYGHIANQYLSFLLVFRM